MLDNYYYPNDKIKIWSKSYTLLTLCGFFFFISTYLFLYVSTITIGSCINMEIFTPVNKIKILNR